MVLKISFTLSGDVSCLLIFYLLFYFRHLAFLWCRNWYTHFEWYYDIYYFRYSRKNLLFENMHDTIWHFIIYMNYVWHIRIWLFCRLRHFTYIISDITRFLGIQIHFRWKGKKTYLKGNQNEIVYLWEHFIFVHRLTYRKNY